MVSLVKKLIKKKLKISFAESCTGGMLSSKITPSAPIITTRDKIEKQINNFINNELNSG